MGHGMEAATASATRYRYRDGDARIVSHTCCKTAEGKRDTDGSGAAAEAVWTDKITQRVEHASHCPNHRSRLPTHTK